MNDDSKIIETIVRAHYDTCDYTRNKIEPFIQKAKNNPSYISCSGTVSKKPLSTGHVNPKDRVNYAKKPVK